MKSLQLVVVAILFCAFAQATFGQTNNTDDPVTANITGMVTDQWGAYLVGAKITLTTCDGYSVKTIYTNFSGEFSLSYLPAGSYTIKAEQSGFESQFAFCVVPKEHEDFVQNFSLKYAIPEEEMTTEAVSLGKPYRYHRGSGMITGRITDPSGHAVQDAIITIKTCVQEGQEGSDSDGVVAVAMPYENGKYEIKLEKGVYAVKVDTDGYQSAMALWILVHGRWYWPFARKKTQNFRLKIASSTETVVLTAQHNYKKGCRNPTWLH